MNFFRAKNCKITIGGETYLGGSEKLMEALRRIATENAETERAFAEKAFNACVVYEESWNNVFSQTTYRYRCAKHLWSVEGPDKEEARQQAIHYLQQYWADGEYDEILRQFADKEEMYGEQKVT